MLARLGDTSQPSVDLSNPDQGHIMMAPSGAPHPRRANCILVAWDNSAAPNQPRWPQPTTGRSRGTKTAQRIGHERTPCGLTSIGGSNNNYLAEREGFEPSVSCPTHVFKTCFLNHSNTSPNTYDSIPYLQRYTIPFILS